MAGEAEILSEWTHKRMRGPRLVVVLLSVVACIAISGVRATPRKSESLCGGQAYPLATLAKDPTPFVMLNIGGTLEPTLLDYGATKSSLWTSERFRPGAILHAAISLPGNGIAAFLLRSDDQAFGRSVGAAGVIGTDLLSHLTVMVDGNTAFMSSVSCPAAQLRASGFLPIRQTGFFSSDPVRVDHDRPNVPIVYLHIGEVRTWAQIDTGYDDELYPYTVDINQALYDRLVASGIRLRPAGSVTVKTCEGVERRRVYTEGSEPLVIEADDGQSIRRVSAFYLVVKEPNRCGGIAALPTPAAQFGASFLPLFQTTVFDPQEETVWIKGTADDLRPHP